MILDSFRFSVWQQIALVLLRFSIGWHLFCQGFGKIHAVAWTSKLYLAASSGPFSGFFQTVAEEPTLVKFSDGLVIWGLMSLGVLLMIGLWTQTAALLGFLMLFLFYIAIPPLGQGGFMVATVEGTELYVNKTLIEAFSLLVVLSFPTGRILGLDIWFQSWRINRHRKD